MGMHYYQPTHPTPVRTLCGTSLTFHMIYFSQYRIYSSERPGRSFNFGFSKGGTYSKKALFRGRRSLNISKRHENNFNLSLISTCLFNQTIRTANKKKILMFLFNTLVGNTTIYKRKIALQARLAVL